MFRRDFIQRLTVAAGAGGLVAAGAAEGGGRAVTYKIKGYSCVTCAVGLEVMLRQQKGVLRAKASYPDANVAIVFNPELVTEETLRAFIKDKGFSVDDDQGRE
jgi:hypothetical protein